MFKQALRSSLIILATFLLISCGGGSTGASSDIQSTSVDSGSSYIPTNNNTPNGTKSLQLSWDAPYLNNDNTPLTDLTGYKIYYGTSYGSRNYSISLNDESLTTYTVNNLQSNTLYYFTITAINSQNIESDMSNIASNTTI